ncbi:hypothetical protein Bbelb_063820 [Branchiostoma belcheri]|nr:hypothetical protein Bbelb_063820 [Branchiostoma belcheri]
MKDHQFAHAVDTDQGDEPLQETAERTTSLSEDFTLASRFTRDKDEHSAFSSVVGSKEQPAMSIWDFAGHDVYYSSHHVFYSHYAIFILTLNLTKALSDPLEPWAGSCAEALQIKTEADVADYHLEAIQAHSRPNKSAGDLEENQGRGPPVIVVGTHKDQVNKKEIEDLFTMLRDHLRGKAIDKDVYDRYFAIDNTKRDPEDPELSDLRDAILKVALQQNHVGKEIPISWLELKAKLMEMEKQGRKYCSLQDVIAATDSSRVPEGYTPEENTVIILRFFHLCGDILFFNTPELRNIVILDPQWFVDVQKTIITIPKFRGLKVKHKWEQLEATGVLEDSLIMEVWRKKQEELKCDLIAHKDELLKMMEQFDLVLQCSPEEAAAGSSSSEPTTYFVPSLLTTAAVKERERLYPSGTKCSKPIFVVFDEKFFPVGVYHRLVIASMRRYNKRKPQAYARCAKFITRNPKEPKAFVITKEFYYLKVELLSSEKEESDCFSHGPEIRKGLDEDLQEIIDKWIPGIQYKWCLQCCCKTHKENHTQTLENTYPSQSPHLWELDEDTFLPIASVSEWFVEEEVICETYWPATTNIDDIGLAHWFEKPEQLQGQVTSILMVNDKYGRSHGGTSTTNRQVAQFLQQHGATVHATAVQASEEDERCAREDVIILHLPVQRTRKNKTPSLEWLTDYHTIHYPHIPQDLKCIVGHADVTSEAAKSIQQDRCQQAKLVLFNHDIPEETEHYKGAEKAMAARKKTKDINEDAKNADAVFSLGRRIYDHFEMKYRTLGESKPSQHLLFLPRPSKVFEDISVQPGGGEKVVLAVGRVTEVDKLKGRDVIARAMGEVAEKITNVRLCVRGIDEDDYEASMRILEENLHSGKIKPTLLPCGTQEDIADDMKEAHLVLMPSRAEPFGLIGLEAIAAGIPVLISDKSGLADMITDLIKEKKCPADMRHRIVETSVRESDLEDTAKRWAKKIEDSLDNSTWEFERAAVYKKELLESKYWEESHQNLLRVCGLNKDE